jgi:hypothetical protein
MNSYSLASVAGRRRSRSDHIPFRHDHRIIRVTGDFTIKSLAKEAVITVLSRASARAWRGL